MAIMFTWMCHCVILYVHWLSCYSTYFTINQMERASQCKTHCAGVPSSFRVRSYVLLYTEYSWLLKHHATRKWVNKEKCHIFLIFAVDRGEWQALCCGQPHEVVSWWEALPVLEAPTFYEIDEFIFRNGIHRYITAFIGLCFGNCPSFLYVQFHPSSLFENYTCLFQD